MASHSLDLPGASARYDYSERPEIQHLVPADARRILDVGCAAGGFGAWLRSQAPDRYICGIEPDRNAARLAAAHYDRVIDGVFSAAIPDEVGTFDLISLNHVLEHIEDPWAALRFAAGKLAPGGQVIAIIPNVRYLPLIADLLLRGRWEYRDTGILDRTHLRFFTRASVCSLFLTTGFAIEQFEPVNTIGCVSHPKLSKLAALVLGDLVQGGFAVRARTA